MSERRWRIYRATYGHVLGLLVDMSARWPERLDVPRPCVLPGGVEVVDLRENPRTRTFDFVVAHPSFDVVPDGQEIPYHGGHMEWGNVVVPLQRMEAGAIRLKAAEAERDLWRKRALDNAARLATERARVAELEAKPRA